MARWRFSTLVLQSNNERHEITYSDGSGLLLKKHKESILGTCGGHQNIVDTKPTILIHQQVADLGQAAPPFFPGNLCLVQTYMAELLQC